MQTNDGIAFGEPITHYQKTIESKQAVNPGHRGRQQLVGMRLKDHPSAFALRNNAQTKVLVRFSHITEESEKKRTHTVAVATKQFIG